MEANEFEEKTKDTLMRLGLGHWRAIWCPDSSKPIRGQAIPEKLLIQVYDVKFSDAMISLMHECIEIKRRRSLRPFRVLVNKLIEGYQEIADHEKDLFIESLPEVFEVFRDFLPSS